MARKKARQRVAIRLIDESVQVLNQYRQSIGAVKKNKTECLNALISSYATDNDLRKMIMVMRPTFIATITEKLKLEVQRTEINRALVEKDTITWASPDLERCLYRDLKEIDCRDPKPCLKTHNLRPEICLACQQLRTKTVEAYREYEEVQRAFRATGKRISLVVGLKKQLEVVEVERDDYKQRYQQDTRTMRSDFQIKLNRKDAKIKQLEKYADDLHAESKVLKMRISTLELSDSDPQRLENLQSEYQTVKTKLETALSELEPLRNKYDDLLKKYDALSELEVEKKEPMVMCPEKGKVSLHFCQKECPDFITCGRYERIREQLQSEG